MLTDAAIRRLLPAASARRVFDGGDVPGFGVKVEASGAKSFFLRYSWAGQRHYLNLGKYPRLGYDRYDYVAEKRAALETWGLALAARVSGENVVPLIARKI